MSKWTCDCCGNELEVYECSVCDSLVCEDCLLDVDGKALCPRCVPNKNRRKVGKPISLIREVDRYIREGHMSGYVGFPRLELSLERERHISKLRKGVISHAKSACAMLSEFGLDSGPFGEAMFALYEAIDKLNAEMEE